MQELLFLGLFVAALAIGWFLGRREAIKVGFMVKPHGSALDRQYFIGLNYLLNEQPDEAIETFIRALEVNPETVETHIAIGKLFCQRGDVERAIKIHQNLLARPNLTREQGDRVQFELARDYLAVGLHNRAQKLLEELIAARSPLRAEALTDLARIYERERDWPSAVKVGQLLVKERPGFEVSLAHYHCQLAQMALQRGEVQQARRHLRDGLSAHAASTRAMIMLAELEASQDRFGEAAGWLKQLAQHDGELIPQVLPLASRCADNARLQLGEFLDAVIEKSVAPQTETVLARADELKRRQGVSEASRYVVEHIQQQPSLRGLLYLVDLHLDHVDPRGRENLLILRGVVEKLLGAKPHYRCGACGFSGRQLHWQCPTCHGWSTIRPLKDQGAAASAKPEII